MRLEYRATKHEHLAYQAAIQTLATQLHGDLVLPHDQDYMTARRVWNGAADRYPTVIARCAGRADVQRALAFARSQHLPIAVRSGGHSIAGHSTCDDGLVIDLAPMKAITIDPATRIARVEPGVTWGEVAHHALPFGLALTSGDMAAVGVGGLTLGGGIGWMVRKHGLTIDNLLAVDLVTANGQFVTATADEHLELFWGLRGGGGNFGIATAFEFRLHPAGSIVGGAVFYDAAEAADILRAYVRYAVAAPDELTTTATIMRAPPAPFIPRSRHGTRVVAIMVCYIGEIEDGQRVVAPLRQLGTPLADLIAPMPYPAMFAMTEAGAIRGRQHNVRSMFLQTLDDDVLETIVAQTASMSSATSMAQLRILGGAMSRVAADATAFAHRDKPAMFSIFNSWTNRAESARHRAWVEEFWRAMQPYAAGAYMNFLGDEGEERIGAAYTPATLKRLVALKNRYDPDNVFHLNQNIKPTARLDAIDGGHRDQVA